MEEFKKNQRGFTLIELLIALGLGAFILSAAYALFASLQQSYLTQLALIQVQEAGRVAVGILRDRLRLAGGLGCTAWHTQLPIFIQAQSLDPWLPQQANTVVHGYHAINEYWEPPLPTYLNKHVRANTDVLVVHHAYEESANLILSMPNTQAALVVPDHINVEVGDTVIVADCHQADMIKISALTHQNNQWWIAHLPPYNKSSELSKNFDVDATLSVLKNAIYYIGDTGRSYAHGKPIYALYQFTGQHQELIEGISALQVQYGVDTNADQAVDTLMNTPPTIGQGIIRSLILTLETQSAILNDIPQKWHLTVMLRNRY